MKRIIILELCFLFLATTFQSDRMTGWVQQTIPRPDLAVKDLQFIDTLTGFIVSTTSSPDSSFIFKTSDGGNSWRTVVKDKLILFSIHFPSSQTGYSAGYSIRHSQTAVLKTTNGGENWDYILSINDGLLDDVHFVNNDTGWVCSNSGFTGGVFRTTNGGQSWQMQMGYTPGPSKVFFVNETTGWVIGSSNSTLYKTTNCGVNWFAQKIIEASDIFFSSLDTGWIIGGSTGLERSINGGNSWQPLSNPGVPIESKLYMYNNTTGWAGGGLHRILASKDGLIWGIQASTIRSYTVSFVDSLHGWAGYSGLVKTTDGGGPITYTGIRRNGEFVPAFELGQNYPNPFNPSTRIKFSIFKSCYLNLKVYNIKGQEAASLISSMGYKPGEYEINFDAVKYSLASGVYFYYMEGSTTDNKEIFVDTKKMLLVR